MSTAARKRALAPDAARELSARYRYSPGILVADTGLAFIAGQAGIDGSGNLVTDPEEQFDTVFRNIGAVLAEAGASYDDIVDMTSFHASFEHFQLFTAVKNRYVTRPPFPTWTAVGARLAIPGMHVEVKCTALTPVRDPE